MTRDAGPGAPHDAGWPWPRFAQVLRETGTRTPCTVHVLGQPGGLLRLRGVHVVDAWTVGTPLSVPPRTRRGDPEPGTGSPTTVLAMADVLFAVAGGRVHGVWEEPGPLDPADGVELERLLQEVDRRLTVLSTPRRGVPLTVESRPVRAAGEPTAVLSPAVLSDAERAVLGLVGGETTVRDIAFLLGRGLYAVAWDVAHLVDVGLLEVAGAGDGATPPPGRVRALAGGAGSSRRRLRAVPPEMMARRSPGPGGGSRHTGTAGA